MEDQSGEICGGGMLILEEGRLQLIGDGKKR